MVTPYVFFAHQRVLPFASPVFSAWLAALAAASLLSPGGAARLAHGAERPRTLSASHAFCDARDAHAALGHPGIERDDFALRPARGEAEADRRLINSESKRLARMVEVFLNVERLTAGQMELKHETIPVAEMVEVCIARVRPLAERKHIAIALEPIPAGLEIAGDRELMEYACYNLLTNAVKYSPQRTTVTVAGWRDHGHIRIAVRDQGIGYGPEGSQADFSEVLPDPEGGGVRGRGNRYRAFHRPADRGTAWRRDRGRPASRSEGSCFTLALPAAASAASATAAERH